MPNSIFLFHRDLRIVDNVGLDALIQQTDNIGLLFILTKEQTNSQQPYFAQKSFQYMLHCLATLSKKIILNIIEAESELSGLKTLIKNNNIKQIYTNEDYTPYAVNRSRKTAQFCQEHQIIYRTFRDYLLFKPGNILTKQNTIVKVFTPFWKQIILKQDNIARPRYNQSSKTRFIKLHHTFLFNDLQLSPTPLTVHFQRKCLIQNIKNIKNNYNESRNWLASNTTSNISAGIKFGVLSIREVVYISLKTWKKFNNPFIRQVCWREFFYHTVILAMQQQTWNWNTNWNPQWNHFPWSNNKTLFQKWKNGRTGYILVDAAMHQLNTTGEMHNRARLVAASFLTKNLLIDWKWGANYFKSRLIDYDPIVNMMSWQWVCGCGLDAAPYFRIFNPILQQKKFDPTLIYCRKYQQNPQNYLPPMVDWNNSRNQYLLVMKELKELKNS